MSVLNTEVDDSDSQEIQRDELRQLVDAQLQAELKGVKMRDSLHADHRMQRCAKHFRATVTAMRE